ncbi:glycosyltransferase [uncultured Ilumatobacter sp.]|jgi:mycofactocin glycosyltransferase|uniref:glycosyltransferase n=1 Tax=uncultured Ilumatobacter sp. TaxID=879968 RepID=UPI00374F8973
MRFAIDGTWKRTGAVVVAGSPLKIFRLTAPGARIAEQIEQGADVASSTLTDRLLDAGAIHPEYRPDATSVFTVDDVTVITPQLGGVASTDGRMVVDDGSRPPIDGAAIRLDSNGGPAAARNAGRPLATTALVAFVDADVDLLADVGIGCWLTQLLPHFDDPSVALVAPRVAGEPGSQLDLGIEPGRVRAGTRIGYVPAAAIVVRADALDEVGGFDPALRFGEDVDLVWRLDQAGWRCRYEPASTVWHEPRSNWPDRLRQHAGYGSAAAPLALRHPDALAPMHTNQWAVGSWLSALGGHPVVAAVTVAASVASLVHKLPGVSTAWSIRMALNSHVQGLRNLGVALRRVWWPPLAILALFSKRMRLVAFGALALDVRATPTDVAYGWGVWSGMVRYRTWRPVMPTFVSWPGGRLRGATERAITASSQSPHSR